MRKILLFASAVLLCAPTLARSAILKPYAQIDGSTVRLTDLFDDLGKTPDRVLGTGPAPGAQIIIESPQLAAIARDFDVDWRPSSGSEHSIIQRRGDVMPHGPVIDAVHAALVAAGAPEDSDIATPDMQPITIPAGATPVPEVSQCNYDPVSSRFTALVSIALPDMPPAQIRLSGSVVVLTSAVVLTHKLAHGAQITAADIVPKRVRASSLRGNAAILPKAAIGMILKHDVPVGQPLTALDVERVELVQRGSLVRMTLNADGIALGAQGIAREGGANGDRIRVENPSSHAVVEAEVVGPGEVRVAPRSSAVSLVSAQ